MNDDMREVFGRAMPESEPPLSLSASSLVRAGKRRRRQRAVGAAASGIAGVAVIAVALPMAMGGLLGGGTPAANGGVLPELDSDRIYGWDIDATEPTEESEKYGEAFWSRLEDMDSDLEYVSDEFLKDEGEAERPTFQRDEETLMVNTEGGNPNDSAYSAIDFRRPVYSLADPVVRDSDGGETSAGPPMVRFPGADSSDVLEAAVYPEGTYTSGTNGPLPDEKAQGDDDFFDLVNCRGGDTPAGNMERYDGEPVSYEIECDETRASDGTRVVELTETVNDEDGELRALGHALVHYRADGTATVLRDTVPGKDSDPDDIAELKPALDFDDLLDLSMSLPDDAVK